MQMNVSEKEIEIERLMTTCQALNARVALVDDTNEEASNAHTRFNESEEARGGLQQSIMVTSTVITEDNSKHVAHQTELTNQINSLHA